MTALAREALAPAGEAPPFLGVDRSARGYRWVARLPAAGANAALALAQRHGLPELLARVMVARGADIDDARAFLAPSLRASMPDPSTLRDMDRGATRLAAAIMGDEPVALFGDYDVDGAASVALLYRFLAAHGREARLYVPDRIGEGYGPSATALAKLAEEGARLILTLDCGTSGHEAVAAAAARGADVIVVDHHLAGEALPECHAVINPNRLDDVSGQGHLAAAGVAYLLLVATARTLRQAGWYRRGAGAPDLLQWLDLVALATVCDVAPLVGLNRALVAKGLRVMRRRRNAGLKALADQAGLTNEPTPYALGFVLGPRINAGGRVGESSLGARLLIAGDEGEAARIAALLDRLNRERKALEAAALEEAEARAERALERDPDTALLVADSVHWHPGVIGLVAARLVERFARPSLVVAWNGGGGEMGTGSARSVAGVDLGSAVRASLEEGLLVKGGGHAMAAGLGLRRERLEAVTAFLEARLRAQGFRAGGARALAIDGALAPAGCTDALMDLLERAGPYGAGHPQPRFALAAARCLFARPVGDRHLRCVLAGGDGSRLQAVAFRAVGGPLGELLARPGRMPLHVAGHLRRDRWGGRARIELVIEDAAEAPCGAV